MLPLRKMVFTSVFVLSTPDEIIEHEADQCVLQCPEVTNNSCVAVHQCPGFTPEEKLSRRRENGSQTSI